MLLMKMFFLGIIFISLFMPILDGIISLFNQFVEFLCLKIAQKTYAIKKMLEAENQEVCTQSIGFHVLNEEEENDDEGENI